MTLVNTVPVINQAKARWSQAPSSPVMWQKGRGLPPRDVARRQYSWRRASTSACPACRCCRWPWSSGELPGPCSRGTRHPVLPGAKDKDQTWWAGAGVWGRTWVWVTPQWIMQETKGHDRWEIRKAPQGGDFSTLDPCRFHPLFLNFQFLTLISFFDSFQSFSDFWLVRCLLSPWWVTFKHHSYITINKKNCNLLLLL